uniref:Uncharacterized protein n=1 Tax=Knipowitschia caucasica TaxID=637954 RepID=A0AAV2MFR4_KNICA
MEDLTAEELEHRIEDVKQCEDIVKLKEQHIALLQELLTLQEEKHKLANEEERKGKALDQQLYETNRQLKESCGSLSPLQVLRTSETEEELQPQSEKTEHTGSNIRERQSASASGTERVDVPTDESPGSEEQHEPSESSISEHQSRTVMFKELKQQLRAATGANELLCQQLLELERAHDEIKELNEAYKSKVGFYELRYRGERQKPREDPPQLEPRRRGRFSWLFGGRNQGI